MGPLITGRYGQRVMEHEVKVHFGVDPKHKWPEQGMPRIQIQGVTCWVNPLPDASKTGRRRFAIRAMCECPACGKVLPIGRLHQHARAHK